jgi:hypothetical protein
MSNEQSYFSFLLLSSFLRSSSVLSRVHSWQPTLLVACWCLPFFRSTSISHSPSAGEFRELFDWEFRVLFDCPLHFLFLFYVFMVYSLFLSISLSSSLASSLTHSTILIFPGTIYIRLNLSQPVHQVRRAVPCATDCNASRDKRLLFLASSLHMPANQRASRFCSCRTSSVPGYCCCSCCCCVVIMQRPGPGEPGFRPRVRWPKRESGLIR